MIARRGRGIASVRDLTGRRLSIGPEGSGTRKNALRILQHYGVDPGSLLDRDAYMGEMTARPDVDAAIMTTGLLNPDLQKVLASGDFDLIPVLDARALSYRFAHLVPFEIPRGFYREGPAVPPEPVRTVAATACLVGRADTSPLLVRETLAAIYETDMRIDFPPLFTQTEAHAWHLFPLHPESQAYFDPYASVGVGVVASLIESIAGIKELLFALTAAGDLLWDRWRRIKAKRQEELMRKQKEVLDFYLNETARIERGVVETNDAKKLEACLNEVTHIKLRALDQLTHEDLRGERLFSIFLMQCANLRSRIESKMQQPGRRTRRTRKS